MAYILNIETATKNCSVSVAKDGKVVSSLELATDGYAHAEKLHVFVGQSLNEAQIQYGDLSAVAVSKGPGSYTGLRIGVSAAKGFCMALGIPLIAIDTLQILALKANIQDGVIVPMLDARRMEVYSAVFNAQHQMIREVKAEIISPESFSQTEDAKIHIIGDCQPKLKTVLIDDKFVYHKDVVYPSANEMAAASFDRFNAKAFEDLAYFEPFYLKDFLITK